MVIDWLAMADLLFGWLMHGFQSTTKFQYIAIIKIFKISLHTQTLRKVKINILNNLIMIYLLFSSTGIISF